MCKYIYFVGVLFSIIFSGLLQNNSPKNYCANKGIELNSYVDQVVDYTSYFVLDDNDESNSNKKFCTSKSAMHLINVDIICSNYSNKQNNSIFEKSALQNIDLPPPFVV